MNTDIQNILIRVILRPDAKYPEFHKEEQIQENIAAKFQGSNMPQVKKNISKSAAFLYFAKQNISTTINLQHDILYIHNYIQWRGNVITVNGEKRYQSGEQDLQLLTAEIYKQAGILYPKFFKMDLLSRVAFLASEMIIPQPVTENKDQVAVVISTTSGCLDVDQKFDESRKTLASPALFVYTLPNIMLGEICIRNGFKGEQMCTVAEQPDAEWFAFYVGDLLQNRNTEACICGYAEATAHGINASLIWVSKRPSALPFNEGNLSQIFNTGL